MQGFDSRANKGSITSAAAAAAALFHARNCIAAPMLQITTTL
jgi:hypothetical protein